MPTKSPAPHLSDHDAAAVLRSLGVSSRKSSLFLRPRSYHLLGGSLSRPAHGARFTIAGRLGDYGFRQFNERLSIISNRLQVEGLGTVHISWIARGHRLRYALSQMCPPGSWAVASGRIEYFAGSTQIALRGVNMEPVDRELISAIRPGRRLLLPVYSVPKKVRQRDVRDAVRQLIGAGLDSSLPQDLQRGLRLPELTQSLRVVHGLDSVTEEQSREIVLERSPFQRRIDVERLFALMRELRRAAPSPATPIIGDVEDLIPLLPFQLTSEQTAAIEDQLSDLRQPVVTQRLIQGDVACGKTVVAQLLLIVVGRAGSQGAYLAPTEVLARQITASTRAIAERAGVAVYFLSGKMNAAERRDVESRARAAEPAIFVGTHPLADLPFANLGLLVVDEEQRFGLEIKDRLKTHNPHVLWMSATPIPRSLAQIRYGAQALTLIRRRPPGRLAVRTKLVTGPAQRARLLDYMRVVLAQGRQIFVVCPAIDTEEMASVESVHAQLSEALGRERTAVLHRDLDPHDISMTLQRFRDGRLGVLVATTIVEVGLDVPNATLMVIHDPERLGLSQLHQIRGRVGRGSERGYCALITDATGPARDRLRYFARTDDGLELAEADLRARGSGHFNGLTQSGLGDVDLLAYADEIQMINDHLAPAPLPEVTLGRASQPFTVNPVAARERDAAAVAPCPSETAGDVSCQFEVRA
jgi:ATP-dependent DNA helicase RecG